MIQEQNKVRVLSDHALFSLLVNSSWSFETEQPEEDEKVSYEGYQVIRTFPSTHDQLDTLQFIGKEDPKNPS